VRRRACTSAVAGVVCLSGALTLGLSASAAPPVTAKWRTALELSARDSEFTSVVAVSPTTVWAFESSGTVTTKPSTWELQGSHWTQRSFPGLTSETLKGAASSATDVWAFTSMGRMFRWTGTRWSGVATFRSIDADLVLGPRDIWVFGQPHHQPAGAWHFNGVRWRRFGPLAPEAVSAVSSTDIWAVTSHAVEHWNGSSWTSTSLAGLLPANTLLCHSTVDGVLATSPTSVWASASGGCQDFGGPFVLLHFNGASWTRLLVSWQLGHADGMAPDGSGGIWIPVGTGSPSEGSMARYADGRLSTVPLPYGRSHIGFDGVSTVPGATETFASGYEVISENNFSVRAALFKTDS
jgi:hypothetical protein